MKHKEAERHPRRGVHILVWVSLAALTATGAILADIGRTPEARLVSAAPGAEEVTDPAPTTTVVPADVQDCEDGVGVCGQGGGTDGAANVDDETGSFGSPIVDRIRDFIEQQMEETGTSADELLSTYRLNDPRLAGYDYENAHELLPAYRWRGNTPLSDSTGILETISDGGSSRVLNGISSLFFAFAKTVWSVMLWATEYALTQSVIDGMATDVNRFFVSLAAGLGGPLVFSMVALLGLFVALKLLMRRGRSGASSGLFRLALTVAVPLATLQVLAAGAQDASEDAPPPTTSPAGLAIYANRLVNAVVGGALDAATSPFNQESVATRAVWSPPSGTLGADMAPQCAPYVDGLYEAYSDRVVLREGAVAEDGTVTVTVNGWLDKSANTMPKHMSRLWETAFLRAYLSANFGHASAWSKAGCHFLDGANDVDPSSARAYALAYGGYDSIGQEPSDRPFVLRRKPSEQIADSFIWVVCDYNTATNAWEPRPGWAIDGIAPATCETWWTNPDINAPAASFDDSSYTLSNAVDNAQGAISNCRRGGWWNVIPVVGVYNGVRCVGGAAGAVWSTGADLVHNVTDPGSRPVYEWGKSGSIYVDIAITEAVREQGDAAVEGKRQMESSLLTHFGAADASGIRLTEGFIAMITALVYAWVLLGLSLGALISQFGLVVMVALLPVTLVMAAIPSSDGTRSQAATRMLRMTAGFLVARLVLLGAITLFIVTISLVQTAVTSIIPGGEGYGRGVTVAALFTMISPLIALFLLRRLMSNLGLGNLMSLRSNAMLPTALARESERREAPSLPKKIGSASRSLAGGVAAGMLAKNPDLKGRKMPEFLSAYGRGASVGGSVGAAYGLDPAIDQKKRHRSGGFLGSAAAAYGRRSGERYGASGGPRDQAYSRAPVVSSSSSAEDLWQKSSADRELQYLDDLATYGTRGKADVKQAERDLERILKAADLASDGTAPELGRPRTEDEKKAAAEAAARVYGLKASNFAVGDFGAPMLNRLDASDVQSVSAEQWERIQTDFSYANAGLGNLGLHLDGNQNLQALRLAAIRVQSGAVDEMGRTVTVAPEHRLSQSEYLEMLDAKSPAAIRPELAAKLAQYQPLAQADHQAGREYSELLSSVLNNRVPAFP